VNHRFFNPSIKLPGALSRWEGDVRDALRQRVARGHVTVSARVERADSAGAVIDEAAFAARAAALTALQQRHKLGGTVDVATVLRMPDVIRAADVEAPAEGTAEELVGIMLAAADALQASREAEGARLVGFIRDRIDTIEAAVARIAARSPERVVAHRERLREAVRELLDGAPAEITVSLEDKTVTVEKSNIELRAPSKISPMPVGLMNTFSANDILDLLAYMESLGDSRHPNFSR